METHQIEQIQEIEIDKIKFNPNNPRKEFNKEKLQELANSIKERGLINPIQVKKVDLGYGEKSTKQEEQYELICGERRLKAHKLANKKSILAIVRTYNNKSDEMIDSLIENLHRDDLNSIERENFITKLWDTKKYKNETELGKAIGISQTQIRTILEAKKIRNKTQLGCVSTRDIRDTRTLKNIDDRKEILKRVERGEINSDKIFKVSKIIKKSPTDVKQAYFKNKISIEQADKISNIKDENIRGKMIKAHKTIKNIDKSIEKDIKKKIPKDKNNLIKTREVIENFRNNNIETQNTIQKTMKSLMCALPYISLMDSNQLDRLTHYQNMFEIILSNALELSENLKEKININ